MRYSSIFFCSACSDRSIIAAFSPSFTSCAVSISSHNVVYSSFITVFAGFTSFIVTAKLSLSRARYAYAVLSTFR